MNEHLPVLIVLGGYLAGMLVIGAVAARRASDSDEFLVAGRSLPLWLCTATLIATWLGSGTVIGAAGEAYQSGLLGVIYDPFGAALCLFLAGLFYVRILRRMRLLTLTDFFEIKYGKLAGLLASVALFVLYIGWTGVQLKAFGLVVETLFGISPNTGMVVGTVIILIYTAAGGMWAVALTDSVQVLIVVLGLAVMLPLVIQDAGGWSAIYAQLPENTFRMIPVENTFDNWLNYIRAWMVIGIGSIATQDLMQRSFAARNESVAQYSAYLAAIAYLTVGMIPVLLGLIGSVTIPDLSNAELVVPELAVRHLHPIAMAIFVGALLAAVMSSADSALLAPASLLSANIIPCFWPNSTNATRMAWARYSIPVIGLAALGTAFLADNVYELMLASFEVPLVCLFVPFTAGIWWRESNRYGALAAMLLGASAWIGFKLIHPDLPAELLGLAASAVALLLVSMFTQESDPPRLLKDRDGAIVPLEDRLGTLGTRGLNR